MKNYPSERGSAIIMLFVAVGLFGMLAYAFMQGSRSSTSMMTDEQAKVYAQQIVAFLNDVRTGVKRLQLRGCTSETLSFGNTSYIGVSGLPSQPDGHNSSAPVDGRCDVFKTAGASLRPFVLPPASVKVGTGATGTPGNVLMEVIKIEDMGPTVQSEVSIRISQVDPMVCKKINLLANVSTADGEPPRIIPTTSRATYIGVTAEPSTFLGDTDKTFRGKTFGCFNQVASGGNYHIYYVIWPR